MLQHDGASRTKIRGARNLDPDRELALPVIPPRSKLYSLPPVGIGETLGDRVTVSGAMVESATGYLMRLAYSHRVHPRRLLVKLILPLLGRQGLLSPEGNSVHSFVLRYLPALNGTGSLARDGIEALERLTGRKNLRYLTLSAWGAVLPTRGLLRRTRAWCPHCYLEWWEQGDPVYEPLLWTFQAIRGCARHRFVFRDCCPYPGCGRRLYPAYTRGRPGHCSWCGGWLGVPEAYGGGSVEPLSEEEWHWQSWVTAGLGALLAAGPTLQQAPERGIIAQRIEEYRVALGFPNLRQLALHVGVDYKTLRCWALYGIVPELAQLLQLCFRLRTTPLPFLTGTDLAVGDVPVAWSAQGTLGPELRPGPEDAPSSAVPLRKPRRRNKTDAELGRLRNVLEAVATGGTLPPPSVKEVARRLKCSNTYLVKQFPELCARIHEQYVRYVGARKLRRDLEITRDVEAAVMKLHRRGEYPSYSRVEAELPGAKGMRGPLARKVWHRKLRELGWKK